MNVLAKLQERVKKLQENGLANDAERARNEFDSGWIAGESQAFQKEIAFLQPIIARLTEVCEKEKAQIVDLSDLHTRRLKVAEARFANHEFESPVGAVNGWETVGNTFSRIVFLNEENYSTRETFSVTFKPDSDIVVE